MTTTETLTALAISISSEIVSHVVVCEFNSEDSTPTLHVNLWRGYSINDLPANVAELEIVAEGGWDGGLSYSLQA